MKKETQITEVTVQKQQKTVVRKPVTTVEPVRGVVI